MNQSLFNFEKVPTSEELWGKEKSNYRFWIFGFGIGIIIILALVLASSILSYLSIESRTKELIEEFKFTYNPDNPNYSIEKIESMANRQVLQSNIIFPSIKLIVISLAVLLYIVTVYRSYKAKNFIHISGFSTTIFFLFALWEFINLFSFIYSFARKENTVQYTPSDWILVVTPFLFVATYYFFGSKVTKIRNSFRVAEKMKALKDNSNPLAMDLSNFMNQTANQSQPNKTEPAQPIVNPFGPPTGTSSTNTGTHATPHVEISKTQEELKREKLLKLSKKQLEEIAQKLSISGYEVMSTEELVSTILRMTKGDK